MTTNYKNKKRILIATLSFLSLLLVISVSLFSYQKAYAGKIYQNVYFDGIDLKGKTKVQAKSIIDNKVAPLLDNKIATKSEDKEFTTRFYETGLLVDENQIVANAYKQGRDGNFFKSIYYSTKTLFQKTNVDYAPNFDDEIYKSYSTKAAESLNIPPVDASLSVVGGQVVANTGKTGVTIDSTDLKKRIASEFKTNTELVTIQMPTQPITPNLLTEDLTEAKVQAEAFMNHQLQLTLNNQIYNADKNTIGSWISFGANNGKYSASLNSAAIKNYINKIAAKNDIPVINTKINAVDNSTIQEGKQGMYTDQDDGVKKITAALNSTTTPAIIQLIQTPRDPQIIKVFPDEGIVPGRFPGKYIDIDLTKQLLTLFDNTNQVGQYIVSTGKASTPTPTGTRTIDGKNPRAWSAPYGLWMPYYISMGGGYGIHELPEWPGGYKEGEAHLGTPVSHGCVRLGVGPAEFTYNWVPDGAAVYIHK